MANSDSQLPPELECHAVFATTHWSMVVSAGDVFTERLHSSGSARPTGRRSTPTSVVARLGQRAFRLAIVGLAWSAVMLLAQTPELRVALPEVRTLAGRPQHAIVRSDGAIVVSGQFAGNEGDPFSNLLVLGSDGRVLKRLPPLLYAREPGSYEAYRPQYRYCDIAFEDGTFIVETETTISIGDYSTSLNRPIHLNADGTVTDILVIGRLNDNGSLDSGFNVDPDLLAGFVGPNEPSPNGFALMPDGKIVIGIHGAVMDGGASVQRATIKQLFPDGRLDAAFQDRLRAPCLQQLIPQTDDNLLVLHRTCGLGASDRTYLARLNNDGSVDSTFDARPLRRATLQVPRCSLPAYEGDFGTP